MLDDEDEEEEDCNLELHITVTQVEKGEWKCIIGVPVKSTKIVCELQIRGIFLIVISQSLEWQD